MGTLKSSAWASENAGGYQTSTAETAVMISEAQTLSASEATATK